MTNATDLERNLTRGAADAEAGLNAIATAPVAHLRSPIAYVPQTPFIINATVKQNVLFGRSFDETRYRASLLAACLDADLKQFPAHDETEIGEKGLNLSGGQRQRGRVHVDVLQLALAYLLRRNAANLWGF